MSNDSHKNRWQRIGELGEGGQGKVFHVLDTKKINLGILDAKLASKIKEIARDSSRANYFAEEIRKAIWEGLKAELPINQGALKVLHDIETARDEDEKRAEERIKNEIRIMTEVSHPNLLKILDPDPDSKWYVSEYQPNGTLDKSLDCYMGNAFESLKALRPVVEGVALLHSKGAIHRDIKPHNIFIGGQNELILGDFGLVFEKDNYKSRISPTFDNVGSRDWMPGWAQGVRVEDVNPSFDIFSLGKVLWLMISGRPKLQLWYYHRDENNLELMFPENGMHLVNTLLAKCIVENEIDCLSNASEMLKEIDKILRILESNADILNDSIKRSCRVCGLGKYEKIARDDGSDLRRLGLSVESGTNYKIYACDNCGHVEFFYIKDGAVPEAWQ